MADKFKEVSKEEFDNFINNYPQPLTKDYNMMGEPPILFFNDFVNYSGWDAAVAKIDLESQVVSSWKDTYYIVNRKEK